MNAVYDESTILTLDWQEHIRKRPGMYIGKLGDGSASDDGIYVLVKEVLDNSVDEFMMGFGKKIEVVIDSEIVRVRDYGRGIPLGKLSEAVSKMNTGAKYDSKVFKKSVGLNGVGIKAVNALSSDFVIRAIREGQARELRYSKGTQVEEKLLEKTDEMNGTIVTFKPDGSIFKNYRFISDHIINLIKNYTFLNSGLTVEFNGHKYFSRNGLKDLLEENLEAEPLYPVIHLKGEDIEVAITHGNQYGEDYYSFVNGQHTSQGGTHLSAFKEGIGKGISEYFKKNWSPQDVREGIIGAIAVKIKSPIFESQTKNKLSNTEIRIWIVNEVKDAIIDFLLKNPKDAEKISRKVMQNEALRKELNEVKKGARESARKVSINIPKLKDCKYHLGQSAAHKEKCDNSMIFITEGDSASGTITKTRDVLTQAVFSLRGKILNVHGKKKT